MSAPDILHGLRAWLSEHGISFREVQHPPTRTSEESARARGEELRIGGKALLMKGDEEFRLFVLPADRKVDSAAIRRELGLRKLRFATPEELSALTGLVPGAVPPFGRPVLSFELLVDSGIRDNERIAFNAGSLTDSLVLAVDDYLRIARPVRIFPFAVEQPGVET
jgi:prolyl-tRNA editing enzyme YbaK/EbsC (Cys-tRNA(Pro) deacylase)